MSIHQKLLELQKAVAGLAKDKSGNSYQYVSGDKLLGVIRPAMDTLGLLLVPEVVEASFTRQDYNLYDKNGNPKPKSEIFCALKLKFTWVDVETGETIVCFWASSGQNNWDKGLGSALTYGERYFLLKSRTSTPAPMPTLRCSGSGTISNSRRSGRIKISSRLTTKKCKN